MIKKIMGLLSLVLALALVSTGYGALIDSFEDGPGAWEIMDPPETLAQSTEGVTDGSYSLQRNFTAGWHHIDLGLGFGIFNTNDTLEVDVTTSVTSDQVGGYLNGVIVLQGGNADGSYYLQSPQVDIASPDGTPTTTTVSFNYEPELVNGPLTGWAKIRLITNAGGDGILYYDNLRVVSSAPPPSRPTVVIGDFEDGSLDNWGPAWDGSPVLANSTIGVTSGSGSLSLTTTGGYYCLQWDAPTIPESLAGHSLVFDLTMIASEWPVGLWTKVADKVALNSDGPSGWKEFADVNAIDKLTGESTSTDWGRWWDTAPDVVKTYSVDISDYDLTGATWFQIVIAIQGGDGIGHFYFDNVQLVGPAPDTGKSTDTILGNWEQDLDGWVVGGGADAVFNDHNGVTLGNYSLDIFIPNGDWNQDCLTLDLIGNGLVDLFKVNRQMSVDVTRMKADYPTDQGSFEWNGIHMVIDAGGDGWSLWQDMGYRAHWLLTSVDTPQTAIWDYGQYLDQIDFDNLQWFTLRFVSNANDTNYTGWVLFYLDNMRLTGAGIVEDPHPANGARDVPVDSTLSWTAGTFAAAHHLYLGTDEAKVTGADMDSDPDVTFMVLDANSFDPNGLEFNTEYFWRVDAVNETNPDSPWTGPVWDFITADFVIVDDFEPYNDTNPGEPGSNRILETWIDGYGDETNGALVGHDFPPYAEQTTVHSGDQSMPLYYDNTGAALQSETQRVWAEPQDWTWAIVGSNALKLYTHGSPQNAPGELYLIIEDGAGVSHKLANPDSTIFTSAEWVEWELSLNEFTAAGVDLAAVTKLVIGIADLPGQAEASGILYVDDIRRYPPVVVNLDPDHVIVPKTATAPIIDGVWDPVWNDVNETQCLITDMVNADSATPEDANDLSARFKVMYDDNNFYIFVEIWDSVIDYEFSDYQGDGLEVYFDGDYSHGDAYDGVNDNQIRITVDDVALADTDSSLAIDGSTFKVLLTPLGYNIEASFPLDVLQIYPSQDPEPALDADGNIIPGTGIALNNVIGFEVQINDNDGGGVRETLLRWHSDDNDSWQNPRLFGQARLVGN
ncbi:MAG: hypothetical protein JSW66_03915 [Phycisphaerales bacterium]|nr:MAG: hypothetical protein JSW66_03915 [Phycisphaerales bacterium]